MARNFLQAIVFLVFYVYTKLTLSYSVANFKLSNQFFMKQLYKMLTRCYELFFGTVLDHRSLRLSIFKPFTLTTLCLLRINSAIAQVIGII